MTPDTAADVHAEEQHQATMRDAEREAEIAARFYIVARRGGMPHDLAAQLTYEKYGSPMMMWVEEDDD